MTFRLLLKINTNYNGTTKPPLLSQTVSKPLFQLYHPKQDAPVSRKTDASDYTVGPVLQQYVDQQWCPIA